MIRIKTILIFIVTAFVFYCSAPTQYVVKGTYDDNGYIDKKLEENRYYISVIGNSQTKKKRLKDIYLLRAAELSKKFNKPYFLSTSVKDDLELIKISKPTKLFKVKHYSIIVDKYKVLGYVRLLSFEEAKEARKAEHYIHKTEKVLEEKSYLLNELKEFEERQRQKKLEESNKNKDIKNKNLDGKEPKESSKKGLDQKLQGIDEELGL